MASQGAGAHRKGSAFELKVSKILSKWTGEHAMRVPSSGANHQQKGEIRMIGDITFPVGSSNSFNYECKNHESMQVKSVLMNNGNMPSFWEQATSDSRRVQGKLLSPMLVFNISHDSIYIVVPYTKWLVTQLHSNQSPCQVQKTYYTHSLTDKLNEFDTILTTLNALIALDPAEVFKHYFNIPWDKYNESSQSSEESEADIKIKGLDRITNIMEGIK